MNLAFTTNNSALLKPSQLLEIVYLPIPRHLCFNGYLCDMRHPFKVGFRNKHTANRRRSPINKHLSKIIVFTIRQRKIIRPKTARINIICILHPFHVQNHNYVNNTPIVLQPSSIAEKDSKHNNRPKKCTYPQVENITILPEHLFSLKKTTSRLLKRQRLCSIRVSHFPRRVSMIIFFQSKSFMRRRVRRYRLRHKIHAIKTRPNNPLRFLQRKNSIVAIQQTI